MTLLDQPQSQATPEIQVRQRPRQRPWTNVGQAERAVSVAAGSILAFFGLARRSLPGALLAGVGGVLLFRGLAGHSFAYQALGLDTSKSEPDLAERGIHIEQAFLIGKSPEDLYSFWRDFTNLPRIMSHLERVDVIDDRRSRWVAKAPRIAGGCVEWEAEIIDDQPNRLIAWRSLPGSQVDCAGQIRFASALGDRGTEVHVSMDYLPPAGQLGHWIATLFGQSAKQQMREDLRIFKRIMETGDNLTVDGQPHGTCLSAWKWLSGSQK